MHLNHLVVPLVLSTCGPSSWFGGSGTVASPPEARDSDGAFLDKLCAANLYHRHTLELQLPDDLLPGRTVPVRDHQLRPLIVVKTDGIYDDGYVVALSEVAARLPPGTTMAELAISKAVTTEHLVELVDALSAAGVSELLLLLAAANPPPLPDARQPEIFATLDEEYAAITTYEQLQDWNDRHFSRLVTCPQMMEELNAFAEAETDRTPCELFADRVPSLLASCSYEAVPASLLTYLNIVLRPRPPLTRIRIPVSALAPLSTRHAGETWGTAGAQIVASHTSP